MVVEIVIQHLRVWPNARVLVSADTNAAINVIAARMMMGNVPIVRWGHPARLPEMLQDCSSAGRRASGMTMQEMFDRFPVLLATLSQCATSHELGGPFHLLIVDEASQVKAGAGLSYPRVNVIRLGVCRMGCHSARHPEDDTCGRYGATPADCDFSTT